MHGKKVYTSKSMYSIQGLRTVSNSLPKGLKKILKKGGHNYNTIIENWSNLVGKKISDACYPKSVKTNKELKSKHNDPNSARVLFTSSKERINSNDCSPFDRAVAFYIVNKCSFSGLTESSSFSSQASNSNFSLRGIEKLPGYQEIISNWNINGYSYEYLMEHQTHENLFIYHDPPYDIKDNLYGNKGSTHKGFDHDRFASDCDKYSIPMMVSYNSDQLVKDRFKDWKAAEFDLTYTMRSVGEYMRDQKSRKELLLMNYSL